MTMSSIMKVIFINYNWFTTEKNHANECNETCCYI